MHYIILRDDDTNALTPAGCLERLYRPFLDLGLPVNLAVIPNVRTNVTRSDGWPEEYLYGRDGQPGGTRPIGQNRELVGYLRGNPGYHIVQHGYDHSFFEFESRDHRDIARRLEEGTRALVEAGFGPPETFVAPYDKLSRVSLRAAALRFRVISTGWFEWRRVPPRWWPAYVLKKLLRRPHWRAGRTLFLSHPGCLLSRFRDRGSMLVRIKQAVAAQRLTVLVTHWWEYFPQGQPDEGLIGILHRTAEFLAADPGLCVIGFHELGRDDRFLH